MDNKTKPVTLAIGALTLSVVLGFFLLNAGSPNAEEPNSSETVSHDGADAQPHTAEFEHDEGNVSFDTHASATAKEPHPDGNLLLAELRGALASKVQLNAAAEIEFQLQRLARIAKEDSRVRQTLTETLLENPNSEIGVMLLDILAEIKAPEVEHAGHILARKDDPVQMKMGLDLLGRLGMPSPETYEIATKAIDEHPDDPDALMLALHILPNVELSEDQSTQTLRQLSGLVAQNSSEGVRSNSIFKISSLARSAEDLTPVMQALDKNRTRDDRVSAVMALAKSPLMSEAIRQKLVAAIGDTNELWEIRSYAAEALERYKLDENEAALLAAFKKERQELVAREG
jgi:hypothetical protein